MRSYYSRSLSILEKMKKFIPNVSLGKHFATALEGCNIENISDKDLFIKLNDYLSTLESDVPHCQDLEQIIKDGLDLNHILDSEE
jgi:hypothetical protein